VTDLKSLLAAQERLAAMAMRIGDETDPEEILRLGEEMRQEAQIVEAQAKAWEAELQAQSKSARGTFEVVLRPDQIARIHEQTGERMETVLIDDVSGSLNAAMVITHPDTVEAYALQVAKDRAARKPAEEAARVAVENALAELDGQGEAMAEQVRNLRNDPTFQRIMKFGKDK
jgi:hypothetical protein